MCKICAPSAPCSTWHEWTEQEGYSNKKGLIFRYSHQLHLIDQMSSRLSQDISDTLIVPKHRCRKIPSQPRHMESRQGSSISSKGEGRRQLSSPRHSFGCGWEERIGPKLILKSLTGVVVAHTIMGKAESTGPLVGDILQSRV